MYVRQDRRPLILARRLRAAGGPNATSERGLARTRARRPLRAAPAASPRSVLGPSAWHPQRRRDPSSRTIRVAPAAVPRPALADGLVEGLSAPGPRRVRLGEDALDRRRERLRVERRVERLHDRVVRLVGRRPRRRVRVRVVRGACGWSGSRPDGSPRLFLVARGWFASRSRRRAAATRLSTESPRRAPRRRRDSSSPRNLHVARRGAAATHLHGISTSTLPRNIRVAPRGVASSVPRRNIHVFAAASPRPPLAASPPQKDAGAAPQVSLKTRS